MGKKRNRSGRGGAMPQRSPLQIYQTRCSMPDQAHPIAGLVEDFAVQARADYVIFDYENERGRG